MALDFIICKSINLHELSNLLWSGHCIIQTRININFKLHCDYWKDEILGIELPLVYKNLKLKQTLGTAELL